MEATDVCGFPSGSEVETIDVLLSTASGTPTARPLMRLSDCDHANTAHPCVVAAAESRGRAAGIPSWAHRWLEPFGPVVGSRPGARSR
jgi:hypothetical protein